jgi:uncharacterized membrane protein YjjP (DUF1212 family)
VAQAKSKDKGKAKRLRYSRLAYDIKSYNKECNIKGIREIDMVVDKVNKSKDKLEEVKSVITEIASLEGEVISSILW